jgi:hypothetical protein
MSDSIQRAAGDMARKSPELFAACALSLHAYLDAGATIKNATGRTLKEVMTSTGAESEQTMRARMARPGWWARVMRKHLARESECLKIAQRWPVRAVRESGYETDRLHVDYVSVDEREVITDENHGGGEIRYVSDDALRAYRSGRKRAARAAARVRMVSTSGHVSTMALLQEQGGGERGDVARHAAMSSGLARICAERGLHPVMVTLTAPPRMHPSAKSYDGTTPQQAQEHLSGCWRRAYKALHAQGVRAPFVRVVEPHKDGCPHWHVCLWVDGTGQALSVQRVLEDAFLWEHEPDAPGSLVHRVKWDPVRAEGQDAAVVVIAYLLKYMRKHLQGGENVDLEAGDRDRIAAWGAIHGIRRIRIAGPVSRKLWDALRTFKLLDLIGEGAPHQVLAAVAAACSGDALEASKVLADTAAHVLMTRRGEWIDAETGEVFDLPKTVHGESAPATPYALRVGDWCGGIIRSAWIQSAAMPGQIISKHIVPDFGPWAELVRMRGGEALDPLGSLALTVQTSHEGPEMDVRAVLEPLQATPEAKRRAPGWVQEAEKRRMSVEEAYCNKDSHRVIDKVARKEWLDLIRTGR